jgi:putative ABC transport system permease protein
MIERRGESESPGKSGPNPTLGRVYSLALTAFPPELRDRHSGEMLQTFETLVVRRQEEAGSARATMFAIRAIGEALWEGVAERGRRRREALGMGKMIDDFVTDVRLSVRGLLRTPTQAMVLIVTLGLGIGASTAIYSLLHAVLLAPLPFPDPEELVSLRHLPSKIDGGRAGGPGGQDLLDYMATDAVEGIAGVQVIETNLNDDHGAARVTMGWTTPDYFQVMGVSAELGRVLRADDWAGADRSQMEDPNFVPPPMAVVLGHGIWSDRFAGDPGVLGRTIRLNGQSMQVVGVLPASFRLLLPMDAEVPPVVDAMALMPVPLSGAGRGMSGLDVVARLADGVSVDQARQELMALADGFRDEYEPHAQLGTKVLVDPLHQEVVGEAGSYLWILFGAVGLLLLIAGTNVASLMIVRAGGREGEFAVRSALGVSRGRILRQLLTEALVLAALGATVGLLLADLMVEVVSTARPVDLPRLDAVALDRSVLLFTLGVSLAVAALFGLAPAVSAVRADPRRSLGRLRASSRGGVRLRRGFIVAELAFSVVLVVGAGLLLRSLERIQSVPLGFDPEGVVAVDAAVPFFPYREAAKRSGFWVTLRQRALDLPGVSAAGVTAAVPLEPGGGGTWLAGIGPDGSPLDAVEAPRARYRAVAPATLTALGVRLREGRDLSDLDEEEIQPVPVLIDAGLADSYWPEGALGHTLRMAVAGYTGSPTEAMGRVVGVVEAPRFSSMTGGDERTVFLPYRMYATVDGTLLLRTDAPLSELTSDVRALIAELDPDVPVYDVRRLSEVVSNATARERYTLLLMAIFAATATAMAAVGLYGVITTLVQQRTREFGIRIALGAARADIGRLIGGEGARLVAAGLVLGVLAAALLGPAVRSLLYQVEPLDPATLVGTVALLAVVSWLALSLPARRAAKLDPMQTLNQE